MKLILTAILIIKFSSGACSKRVLSNKKSALSCCLNSVYQLLYFLEFPSKVFFVFYDFFIDILYAMSG